jgi:hypothetical protein
VVGWLGLWLVLGVMLPRASWQSVATLAGGVLVAAALVPRLRRAWRPVSASTTLVASRGLGPGDHAWFVHGNDAERVLVTARHGLRVVIARPGHDAAEGIHVRRTRVLLLRGGSRLSG